MNASSGLGGRLFFIDALKALGSQFIVLHHLAFYGPMSDWTHRIAPDLVAWFSQDARMAVQVFLVVAGFLAARSLAPDGVLLPRRPRRLLWQRYVRVALPYIAALLVAMLCTELARRAMTHDSLPDRPHLDQFIAHALLVQSVLGMESLSAGVWYVAIDFQLYALLLGLLWLARHGPAQDRLPVPWVKLLAAVLVVASLFHFNREPEWDSWALYFFGAYGLGVMTHWCTRSEAVWHASGRWVMAALVAATLLALAIDFRTRIALALVVSMLLGLAQLQGWLHTWPRSRVVAYLGRISYSVFLLNFPVALVVNALFTRYANPDPLVQTLGVLLAWLACNAAGALFHHTVELRLSQWGRTRGPLPAMA
ncbi:acyltransferase [Hydrogenophaga sp.]|uniref:acyltransferase family protein n=1 Tax=Hydrogenophaga sp. TaxID=1904254 RepID=UPI00261B1206|nr:acyltransferase [Hydrogenophaga sp.]MCW5655355.1 acyltransferase [Hydrogenophaga sp.]